MGIHCSFSHTTLFLQTSSNTAPLRRKQENLNNTANRRQQLAPTGGSPAVLTLFVCFFLFCNYCGNITKVKSTNKTVRNNLPKLEAIYWGRSLPKQDRMKRSHELVVFRLDWFFRQQGTKRLMWTVTIFQNRSSQTFCSSIDFFHIFNY